jgi:hypothetical protein
MCVRRLEGSPEKPRLTKETIAEARELLRVMGVSV